MGHMERQARIDALNLAVQRLGPRMTDPEDRAITILLREAARIEEYILKGDVGGDAT